MWMAGQAAEGLRLALRVIDLAEGDPTKGSLGPIGSPLAVAIMMRGYCRYCLGVPGWREDLDQSIAMARSVDAMTLITAVLYKYRFAAHAGALLPDAAADRDTAEAMQMAEHSGDDFAGGWRPGESRPCPDQSGRFATRGRFRAARRVS